MVVVVVFVVVVVVVVVAVGVGSEMDGEWAKESRELGWRSESTSSRQVVEKKKKKKRQPEGREPGTVRWRSGSDKRRRRRGLAGWSVVGHE
jgi:hypothetical protein